MRQKPFSNILIKFFDFTFIRIKINTSNASKGPNKDWLNFVITTQARGRIKSFYSKIEKEDMIDRGSDMLEKEIRKSNLSINELLNNKNIDNILNEYKLSDIDELYIDIASGKRTATSIIKFLTKKDEPKENLINKINENVNKQSFSKNEILVEGISDIKVSLSGCCNPIPGDKIIGYITKGAGITVHRTCCKNIADIDERLVSVKWNNDISKKFATDLIIYTNSSDNLLDIITKASSNNITIDSVTTLNKSEYKVYSITVLVENVEKLNKFCIDLNNLGFVSKVERLMK